MNFLLCKLIPKGSFHIGKREGWYEDSEIFIHSDTLFSALCNNYLLLYGKNELTKLLEQFLTQQPPFLISSIFPIWNDIYYFPVSLISIAHTLSKKIKKIKFVSVNLLNELLQGKTFEDSHYNQETIPLISEKEILYPWKVESVPRIGLNRLSNHPGENYFHFGQVFYQKDSNLFFLIDIKNANIEKKLKSAIYLLVDEGIGGDRTCGKGFFYKPEFKEISFDPINSSNAFYSLSLYYPTESEAQEIDFGKSYYNLLERKGYIFSLGGKSIRRRSIRTFIEGSVFFSNKILSGKLVDVTPDTYRNKHNVYRYGFAFFLPCK